MKKAALILAVIVLSAISSFSQDKRVRMLTNWTFDSDTTIDIILNDSVPMGNNKDPKDFRWGIQIDCNSLTGTLDGTIGIKSRMNNLNSWTYVCQYPLAEGCLVVIDSANFNLEIKDNYTMSDNLRIELTQNNISGGTVDIVFIKIWNRD